MISCIEFGSTVLVNLASVMAAQAVIYLMSFGVFNSFNKN